MPEALDRLKAALADRYRIERELGAGGMATVYLAEDVKHKRQVAIKVLRPELAAVLGAERFVQETKIALADRRAHDDRDRSHRSSAIGGGARVRGMHATARPASAQAAGP